MSKLENIGDIFTEEGHKMLAKGQLLVFEKDKIKRTYRIISLPGNKNVWVRELPTISGEDLQGHVNHRVDTRSKTMRRYGGPVCMSCNVIIGKEISPEDYLRN